MADENTSQSGEQQQTSDQQPTGETEGGSQESEQQNRTPEDVEAYWKNRQSQEARAAAEREKVLREQLSQAQAAAKAAEAKATGTSSAANTEVEVLRQQNENLSRELEQTKQSALIETRKAKYPFASADIDEKAIAIMDEASLAGLNEKLKPTGSSGTRIDPSQAGRPTSGGAPKALNEKTAAELRADLAAQSGEWAEAIKR